MPLELSKRSTIEIELIHNNCQLKMCVATVVGLYSTVTDLARLRG